MCLGEGICSIAPLNRFIIDDVSLEETDSLALTTIHEKSRKVTDETSSNNNLLDVLLFVKALDRQVVTLQILGPSLAVGWTSFVRGTVTAASATKAVDAGYNDVTSVGGKLEIKAACSFDSTLESASCLCVLILWGLGNLLPVFVIALRAAARVLR